MTPRRLRAALLLAGACVIAPRSARAVMDIGNNGAVLDAGRFAMRVTNVGVIGNAFFNKGLSFDPSFEFPRGSGQECLEHAELWVAATREDGLIGVSGGPALEWRPTLDPNDLVVRRYAGDRGTRPNFDDDGDGKIDEEALDGKDNDGDGEIDEDVQFPAQETCTATYTDDTKEAIEFGFENGERHVPLGLSVVQQAHAWSIPGYDKMAGIEFTITNHTQKTLRDLRVGVYANLDSRAAQGGPGHLNDKVSMVDDTLVVFDGRSKLVQDVLQKDCFSHYGSTLPAVHDGDVNSGLPWVALQGLSHTTDPLGYLVNYAFPGAAAAQAKARAPRRDTTFRYDVFSLDRPPRQGGPPQIDVDRYAALRGEYPTADTSALGDYAVLLSCGPFATLGPGQSIDVAVAFVAGENRDSLVTALRTAHIAWRGTPMNLLPDRGPPWVYNDGSSDVAGHEICYTPPDGVEFAYDPHCITKFYTDRSYYPPIHPVWPPGFAPPSDNYEIPYRPGQPCIWSDFDCDACTGLDGKETPSHWYVQAPSPPQPLFRSTAGDREVTVEWDNLPELLADASVIPGAPFTFWGYRVYRLDRWNRSSLLPPTTDWQQVAAFAVDTTFGARPLREVLDSTVAYDSVAYEHRHYPVGRYRFVDDRVLDGFDYNYVVTSVTQKKPNPFKAHAPWEREPVPGDAFTRHIDFFGLPNAVARIRIYTLAGDLVQTIDHDGTHGDGQAPWNLISRNGQDIESGIYLFTVEWPGHHQVGRFVVIR
jgi:hypothetical protein